ncbi:HisA/HisF family protein [soil metagenome]
MKPRIIPVIDILHGQVVRGVGGRRNEYRPIVSRITDSTEPLTVARAILAATGAREIYVADLDAIVHGRQPSNEVFNVDAKVWLDTGAMITQPLPFNVTPILAGECFIPESLLSLKPSAIFSIDMMNGVLLGDALNCWLGSDSTVINCVRRLWDYGIHRFIILDIYEVGERRGLSTLAVCQELKAQFTEIELITGGGIRNADDLRHAADAGVDAVLISTAIHDGTIL